MKAVILMKNNSIVIIYKEVGKNVEFMKVQNELKVFQDLIGGELDSIPYKDIIILARKNRKNLKPNIYINSKFLSLGESIRGNIVILCKENTDFKSLNKEQALKYREFLKQNSFNYDDFAENRKYLSKIKNHKFKNQRQRILEREIDDYNITKKSYNSQFTITNDETLKMILEIQAIILKFIKTIKIKKR